MTYKETMSKLSEMRSRYDAGFSSEDRNFLEKLNTMLFYKRITVTGCSDCYRDAYIIITNKLKKLKAMPKAPTYLLAKGCILHEAGAADWYVGEVPEKVAEAYLKKYPHRIDLFQKYPADWEQRINKEEAPAEAPEAPVAEAPEAPVAEAPAEAPEAPAEAPEAPAEAPEAPAKEPEKPKQTTRKTSAKKPNEQQIID